MREIKFRAWDEATQDHWEPKPMGMIYFDIGHTPHYIRHTHNEKGVWEGRFKIMQFTGLKDVNGVDIYEGDIVKWGHVDGYIESSGARVAVVDMSAANDGLTFDAFKPTKHRFKLGNFMYRNSTQSCMEVIGNIHQNPELRGANNEA